MQWTVRRLERALRKALLSKDVRLRVMDPYPSSADVVMEGDRARIKIDEFSIGLVRGAVHELLHFVLRGEMETWDEELEEVHIEALEERLMTYIPKSKARWYWWRNAVKRKLA
jgi:hypothetical protein